MLRRRGWRGGAGKRGHCGETALVPLRLQMPVDDLNNFDEEGGGAGGGGEDLDEGFVGRDGALFARLVGEWR